MVTNADLSSMDFMVCGAAPLDAGLTQEAMARTKVPIRQGWGMTETTCVGNMKYAQPHDPTHTTLMPECVTSLASKNVLGSVGVLIPGQQARIVDENGRDVKAGERGEYWIRGPNIIRAYHNNPSATQNSLTRDGWYKTGDVAYVKDEYWYIVDRTKELIKYKGFQVAPAELEALLLTSPLVADVAVIGGMPVKCGSNAWLTSCAVHSPNDATELPRAYGV